MFEFARDLFGNTDEVELAIHAFEIGAIDQETFSEMLEASFC